VLVGGDLRKKKEEEEDRGSEGAVKCAVVLREAIMLRRNRRE